MRRALVAVALAAAVAGCGGGNGKAADKARAAAPVITLGTKNFTEQYVLGQLYRQTLEQHGFRVVLKPDIGSSEIIDQALTAGSLDMYPEYTGTLLSEIARVRNRPRSAQAAYARAQAFEARRGFTVLRMTPFSDSNALAVRPAFASANHLRAIGDLKRVPFATIGAPPEFRTRFEGSVGLRTLYGLSLRVKPLQFMDRYPALDENRVQVLAVFTTEGQLATRRYRVLADPRGLFAFQNLAPVIRTDLVRKYGARLTAPLNALSGRLTTNAMRAMNAAVDLRGQSPAAVAARFLRTGKAG
jgi:osmoprotectant transport system substrate-binding protein